jgi:uncharacterized radical SAM superfamily Fe-S cluster-containing enzyme
MSLAVPLTIELDTLLGETESVCPECLARVPAVRVARGADVYLRKACPAHGRFEAVIWRGRPGYTEWVRTAAPVFPNNPVTAVQRGCPFDCGLCPDHRQQSCCVLIEVTHRCDLRCPVCFADAGGPGTRDMDPGEIEHRLRGLWETAGPVNLQLSGGEPCVRDDLSEIAALARRLGFGFIQVNTNGLRLAREPEFARRLAEAGVATIFLQFDGTRDDIYRRLRGRPLLKQKLAAIENCALSGLGVVLVPTVAPGVNADDLGAIVRLALQHQPGVRGVHFQPVSYFGRYPEAPTDADRITLPEIMQALEAQTEGQVRVEHFQPGGAEHALCSFSGNFVSMPDGSLHALARSQNASGCCGPAACEPGVARARDFVARSWAAPPAGGRAGGPAFGEWDTFLERARTHTLCLSGMAFQDAWTLDLERLRQCHIHFTEPGGACIPFCAYNLSDRHGRALYRSDGVPATA